MWLKPFFFKVGVALFNKMISQHGMARLDSGYEARSLFWGTLRTVNFCEKTFSCKLDFCMFQESVCQILKSSKVHVQTIYVQKRVGFSFVTIILSACRSPLSVLFFSTGRTFVTLHEDSAWGHRHK